MNHATPYGLKSSVGQITYPPHRALSLKQCRSVLDKHLKQQQKDPKYKAGMNQLHEVVLYLGKNAKGKHEFIVKGYYYDGRPGYFKITFIWWSQYGVDHNFDGVPMDDLEALALLSREQE